MNHYLKSTDHAALFDALKSAGLLVDTLDESGNVTGQHPARDASLDVIGVIWVPTAAMDDEGRPIMAPTDGYHANLIADLTPEQTALLPLIDAPANPVRVWA